jgi:hypothetical protein
MSRSIRTITLAAGVASALTLSPTALAGGGKTSGGAYPDTTGVGVIHASTVTAQAAKSHKVDTTGVGLIHASMVEAQVADRAALASTDTGFRWQDAGIGAAAGFGVALAGAGLAVGLRHRRRIAA